MSDSLYARIDGDYLDKNRKKARQTTIDNMGEEDAASDITFENEQVNSVEMEMSNDGSEMDFTVDSKLGYFSFTWKPTTDDLIEILEFAVKKTNRIKTMLEAMK